VDLVEVLDTAADDVVGELLAGGSRRDGGGRDWTDHPRITRLFGASRSHEEKRDQQGERFSGRH
jgi:hypothetical protein